MVLIKEIRRMDAAHLATYTLLQRIVFWVSVVCFYVIWRIERFIDPFYEPEAKAEELQEYPDTTMEDRR